MVDPLTFDYQINNHSYIFWLNNISIFDTFFDYSSSIVVKTFCLNNRNWKWIRSVSVQRVEWWNQLLLYIFFRLTFNSLLYSIEVVSRLAIA